jgi:1-acyl-sn-glycerol-3-phosphate acyltransferase
LLEACGALARALLRITLLIVWLVLSLVSQIAGFILRTGDGRHLRLRFYRGALRILGIRIQEFGDFSSRRPLFLVANHVSYLDIFILGSLIPAVFVSKYEVRHWPLVGWVAAIQKTIFITRNPRQAALEVKPLTEALNDAHNVIVFPEGTSTDGQQVERFKTTLFEAPIQANAFVQPVGLVYRDRSGGELSNKDRAFYTWGTDAHRASRGPRRGLDPPGACPGSTPKAVGQQGRAACPVTHSKTGHAQAQRLRPHACVRQSR